MWVRDNLYNVTYDVTDEAVNRHSHTWTEIPIDAYNETGGVYTIVNEQTAIDRVENSIGVYAHNGQLVVPTEVGQLITVYNMMGQTIYSTWTKTAETYIDGLPLNQVLVVRVGHKMDKVVL